MWASPTRRAITPGDRRTAIADLLGHAGVRRPGGRALAGRAPRLARGDRRPGARRRSRHLAEWIAARPGRRSGRSAASPSTASAAAVPAQGPGRGRSRCRCRRTRRRSRRAPGSRSRTPRASRSTPPDRNYQDPFHKPELIFALSETFDALCGFRELARDPLASWPSCARWTPRSPTRRPRPLDALENRARRRDGAARRRRVAAARRPRRGQRGGGLAGRAGRGARRARGLPGRGRRSVSFAARVRDGAARSPRRTPATRAS